MVKAELDEYCEKIFAFIALQDNPLRFNELYKALNKADFKISRPTLIAHLNHLRKHKVIIRKTKGKQEVSYDVNWAKLDYLKYHKDFRKHAERIQKNKATFDQFGLDEKITYVSLILGLMEVVKLEYEIRAFLEPNRRFEATLAHLFTRSYLEPFRMYLLRDCIKSEQTAKEALALVEKLEQKIRAELY
jgi:DNA-binding HxlR family transcriptional regulator